MATEHDQLVLTGKDEATLREMLESCSDLSQRKKIRAAIREVICNEDVSTVRSSSKKYEKSKWPSDKEAKENRAPISKTARPLHIGRSPSRPKMETREKQDASTEGAVNGDGTGHSSKALEDIDNEEELLQMLRDTTDYKQRKEIRLAIRALKKQSEGEAEGTERSRRPSGGRLSSSTVTGLAARKNSASGSRQLARRNSGHLVACRSGDRGEAEGRKAAGSSSTSHKVLERKKSQERLSSRKSSQDGESSGTASSPTQRSRRKSSSSSETSRSGRHPSIEDIEDEAILLKMVKEASDVEEKRRLRARIRAVRRLSRDRKELTSAKAQGGRSSTQSDSTHPEEEVEKPEGAEAAEPAQEIPEVSAEDMECAQEIPEDPKEGLTNGDADHSSAEVNKLQESGEVDLSSKTEEDLQYMLLVCSDFDERRKIRQALRTAKKTSGKDGQQTGSTTKQASTAGSVQDSSKPTTRAGKEIGKLSQSAYKLENGPAAKKSTSYRKDIIKKSTEGKVAELGNKWEAFVDKSNPFGRRNSNSKEAGKEKSAACSVAKTEKAASKVNGAVASLKKAEKASSKESGATDSKGKSAAPLLDKAENTVSKENEATMPKSVPTMKLEKSGKEDDKEKSAPASVGKEETASSKENGVAASRSLQSMKSEKLGKPAEKQLEKSTNAEKDKSDNNKVITKEKKQGVRKAAPSITPVKESTLSVSLTKKGKSWEGLLKEKSTRYRVYRLEGKEDKNSAEEEEETSEPPVSEEETATVADPVVKRNSAKKAEEPSVDLKRNGTEETPASGSKWDSLFSGKSSRARKIVINEDTLNSLPRGRVKSDDSEAGKEDAAADRDDSDDAEMEKDVSDDADVEEEPSADVTVDGDTESDKDTLLLAEGKTEEVVSAGEDADSEPKSDAEEYTKELSDTESDLCLLVDTDAKTASGAEEDRASAGQADTMAETDVDGDNKSSPCVNTTQSHTLETATTISGINRDKKTNHASSQLEQEADEGAESGEQDMEFVLDEEELAGLEEEVTEDQSQESENQEGEEGDSQEPQDLKDEASPLETIEESQNGAGKSSGEEEGGTSVEESKAEMSTQDTHLNASEAAVDTVDSTSQEEVKDPDPKLQDRSCVKKRMANEGHEVKVTAALDNLESIEDEEQLEKLLDQTTEYDDRKRIRAALRILRKKKREGLLNNTVSKVLSSLKDNQSKVTNNHITKDDKDKKSFKTDALTKRFTEKPAEKLSSGRLGDKKKEQDQQNSRLKAKEDKKEEKQVKEDKKEEKNKMATRTTTSRSVTGSGGKTTETVTTETVTDDGGGSVRSKTVVTSQTKSWGGSGGASAGGPKIGSVFDREDPSTKPRKASHQIDRQLAEKKKEMDRLKQAGRSQSMKAAKSAFIQKLEGDAPKPGGGTNLKRSFSTPARSGVARVPNASAVKDMLLRWCRSKTSAYEHVEITNFSTSWSDGMAFCALIHHFFPDAFDYDALDPKNKAHNFKLAFDTAEEKADVPQLLDVEDMVRMKVPDWKCVFTYLQCAYRALHELDK